MPTRSSTPPTHRKCWVASSLFHACIDNAIHSAAGPRVREDCDKIMRRQGSAEGTGWAKVTRAYNLPSRYICTRSAPSSRRTGCGPARTLAGRLLSILAWTVRCRTFVRWLSAAYRPAYSASCASRRRGSRCAPSATGWTSIPVYRSDRPERVQSGRPANLPAPVAGRRNGGKPHV